MPGSKEYYLIVKCAHNDPARNDWFPMVDTTDQQVEYYQNIAGIHVENCDKLDEGGCPADCVMRKVVEADDLSVKEAIKKGDFNLLKSDK